MNTVYTCSIDEESVQASNSNWSIVIAETEAGVVVMRDLNSRLYFVSKLDCIIIIMCICKLVLCVNMCTC